MATLKNTTADSIVTTNQITADKFIKVGSTGNHILKPDGDHIYVGNNVFNINQVLLIGSSYDYGLGIRKHKIHYKLPGLDCKPINTDIVAISGFTFPNLVAFNLSTNDITTIFYNDNNDLYNTGYYGNPIMTVNYPYNRRQISIFTCKNSPHSVYDDTILFSKHIIGSPYTKQSITASGNTLENLATWTVSPLQNKLTYWNGGFGPMDFYKNGLCTGSFIMIMNKPPQLQWFANWNSTTNTYDSTLRKYYRLTSTEFLDSNITAPPQIVPADDTVWIARDYTQPNGTHFECIKPTITYPIVKYGVAGRDQVNKTMYLASDIYVKLTSGNYNLYAKTGNIIVDGIMDGITKNWTM